MGRPMAGLLQHTSEKTLSVAPTRLRSAQFCFGNLTTKLKLQAYTRCIVWGEKSLGSLAIYVLDEMNTQE